MLAAVGSSIKLWENEKFIHVQDIKCSGHISNVSWNNDGRILGALQDSSAIPIFSVHKKTCVQSELLKIMDNVRCVDFCNTTSQYIAVAGSSHSLYIWDVYKNSKKKEFYIPGGGITKVSFNYSDSHLVAATKDAKIFVISNLNKVVNSPFKFSSKTRVTDLKYSALNRSLIGGCGEDGTVVFADANAAKIVKSFGRAHSAPAAALAFSPLNELLMVSVGYDKRFNSYNTTTKKKLMSFEVREPVTSVTFVDNQRVALGSISGNVFVYDIKMLDAPLLTLKAFDCPVKDLQAQPLTRKSSLRSLKQTVASPNKSVPLESSPKIEAESRNDVTNDENNYALRNNLRNSSDVDLLSPIQSIPSKEVKQCEKSSILSGKESPLNSMLGNSGILSPLGKENASPDPRATSKFSKKSSIKPDICSPLNDIDLNCQNRMSFLSPEVSLTDLSQGSITSRKMDASSFSINVSNDLRKKISMKSFSELRRDESNLENINNSPIPQIGKISDPPPATRKQSAPDLSLTNPSSNVAKASRDRLLTWSATDEEPSQGSRLESLNNVTSQTRVPPVAKTKSSSSVSRQETFASFSPTKLTSNIVTRDKLSSSPSVDHNLSHRDGSSEKSPDGGLASETPAHPVLCDNRESRSTLPASLVRRRMSSDASVDALNDLVAIAFPVEHGQTDSSPRVAKRPISDGFSAMDPMEINLSLIKNFVEDTFERHQLEANRRLMHVHCSLLKEIYFLKVEMRELMKKNSINNLLLRENELLKQEIDKYRCNY